APSPTLPLLSHRQSPCARSRGRDADEGSVRVRPLRWRTLVITVAVSFGLSLAFTWSWLRGGATPVDVPWTTLPVALAASVVVLYLGWAIRQYKRGKRGPVDPQRAVRTVLLAQASAYAGALLSGV